ncbi:hypothetical protein PENTCL1PPCAC_12452 [Pristionchus entomophagus]|uniref:Uncharacterized protein n=1 Tax=Pristionchus entomophagus TaxID=358040 RepID=A0AAV5T5N3_9BILA|nr:hypothetical protein PENTCL1PPCAC_12452 [Pristionchus entomophagus]
MRFPLRIARRFKFAVVDPAEALAKRTVAVAKDYEIRPLTMVDFPHLMDLGEGFVKDDSLMKAISATFPLFRRSLELVFTQAIASQEIVNTSLIVTHKASGKPVGYRLYYPVWRDELRGCPYAMRGHAEEQAKHKLNEHEKCANAMQNLFYNKFWEMHPDEKVTFRGDTVHVSSDHRGNGIFHVLYEYDLRFDGIRKNTGAKYFTGIANAQKVKDLNLSSMKPVFTGPTTIRTVDGTEVPLPAGAISLMAREMEGAFACDVKPHWEKMKLI